MTVTSIDPPLAPLSLVSSTGASLARDHRYRAGAQLGRDARALLRQVLQDALESGSPVDPDALRVVLAAKQANHPGPVGRFTSTGIWQLLFVDVIGWCRTRQLGVPAGAVKALRATIEYLGRTDTLAPGSDRLSALHDAIDECSGGSYDPDVPAVPGERRGSIRSQRGPKRS